MLGLRVALLAFASQFLHIRQAPPSTIYAAVKVWLRFAKLLQICEAYSANRYPFPEDQGRRREINHEVNLRLQELHTTIDAGALVVTLRSAGCHCCVALQRNV